MRPTFALAVTLLAIAAATGALAQPTGSAPVPTHPPVRAVRTEHPIEVDGLLDEPAWQQAEPITPLLQRDPDLGQPPRQRTEAFILYDDDAVYVGARLHDSAPDSIVARLSRRDNDSRSDKFAIGLDPFHDKRSGYYFGISAAGTLYDGTYRNDSWDDDSWDGVWDGRAQRTSDGWSLELRIPFSQLRFRTGPQMVWGFNLYRSIPRYQEEDYLVYQPRDDSRYVSLWPELVGLDGVRPTRNVELTPYTTGKAEFLQHDPDDPFHDGSRLTPNVGADLRTNLGSNLTLNATINPDFGQVEVDPAVVNLSDAETYFQEKRPFFVENSSVFNCGNNGASDYWGFNWWDPTFFYTRRIGRAPEGRVPREARFADVPLAARILGAAKLTGQPAPGWNFGTVHAITSREEADLQLNGGARSKAFVEPLSYYGVVRGMREFKDQRQGLGLMTLTTLRQFPDGSALTRQLNRGSFVTALDGWVFLDPTKTWVLSGWAAGTHVAGSRERMVDLQRSPQHYFQRPDADWVDVDSTRTSLDGYGARVWLNKQKGRSFANFAVGALAPGFDVNDLGFFQHDDWINAHGGAGYSWTEPGKWTRNKMLMGAVASAWDFGGTHQYGVLFGKTRIEFMNHFSLESDAFYNPPSTSSRRTRGGPRMGNPGDVGGSFYLDTDGSRNRFYYVQLSGESDDDGSWSLSVAPGITWKPASNVSLSLEPSLDRSRNAGFYVDTHDDALATLTYGTRYVFANLEQNTLGAGIRLNVSFTPTMSLQFYGQPLVATGHYSNYGELAAAGSGDIRRYGTNAVVDTGVVTIDPDGAGGAGTFTLRDPDFTSRSLIGNAVARWEYRPGSTLYLVWTQSRSGFDDARVTGAGEFRMSDSLGDLARAKPNNIFLVKVAHHFQL